LEAASSLVLDIRCLATISLAVSQSLKASRASSHLELTLVACSIVEKKLQQAIFQQIGYLVAHAHAHIPKNLHLFHQYKHFFHCVSSFPTLQNVLPPFQLRASGLQSMSCIIPEGN
jgi:hypothetical protein